jgi:hypothetical protein
MIPFNIKKFLYPVLLFSIFALTMGGCQKEFGYGDNALSISEAKKFILLSTKVADVKNAKITRKYSIYKISNFLDWQSVKSSIVDGKNVLMVPVLERSLDFESNISIGRFVAFYKENNHVNMRIVEVIQQSKKALEEQTFRMAIRGVESLFTGAIDALNEPGTQVICYDQDYKKIRGASRVSTKQILGSKFMAEMSRIGGPIKPKLTQNSTMEDCLLWGVYLVTTDSYGNVISEVLLYKFTTGDCSNVIDLEFVTPDVGGGTSIEIADLRKYVMDIMNQLQSPCFVNAFAKINDPQVSGRVGDIFDFDMAKLLHERFGVNSVYNLKISEGVIPIDPVTGRSPDGVTTNYGNATTFVKINTNLLQSNASQEYVVATLLHEFVHALINVQAPPGNTDRNFANNFEHAEMAEDYIRIYSILLRKHFPNLSTVEARELAWGGLYQTNAFKTLNAADRELIISTNYRHKTGGVGTPCN